MPRESLQEYFVSTESQEETVETMTLAESMEAEMLEVEEAQRESEDAADDVRELESIADGLESIVADAEASLEDGGLDESAARYLGHAVNAHTSRLGLESDKIVASLESFGGATGRTEATTISVESLKDTIKRIWNAIKTAVKKAMEAVANFFAKIFGGAKKLESRAAALEKALGDIKGKSASDKIAVPGASKLHLEGKLTGGEIIKGLESLRKYTETGIQKQVAGSISYYNAVSAKVASSEVQKAMEEAAATKAIDEAKEDYVAVMSKIDAVGKPMSGGVQMVMEGEAAAGDSEIQFKSLSMKKTGKSVGDDTKIDVPSVSDLEKILGHTKAIVKAIGDKERALKDLAGARKAAMEKSEQFVKAGEGGKLGKAWTQGKVNMALRSANADLVRPISQITGHSFSVARSALSLVEKSIAAYGGEAKAEDEKDEKEEKKDEE